MRPEGLGLLYLMLGAMSVYRQHCFFRYPMKSYYILSLGICVLVLQGGYHGAHSLHGEAGVCVCAHV